MNKNNNIPNVLIEFLFFGCFCQQSLLANYWNIQQIKSILDQDVIVWTHCIAIEYCTQMQTNFNTRAIRWLQGWCKEFSDEGRGITLIINQHLELVTTIVANNQYRLTIKAN